MHHPSISKSYIVPAIFLNPVLFLMSLNTILSRVLPPITVDAAKQPPPYSTFGPSAQHPHVNIHASEKLCWGYTFLIVCAQLAAFGRVNGCREAGKEKARVKRERAEAKDDVRKEIGTAVCINGNGHANGSVKRSLGTPQHHQYGNCPKPDPKLWHLEAKVVYMNGKGHTNGSIEHLSGLQNTIKAAVALDQTRNCGITKATRTQLRPAIQRP